MSADQPAKRGKREPWEVIDDLLAEAEIARVEGLTDAELDAEMRAAGVDPAKVPSPEEMLAQARKRAGDAPKDNVRALPVGRAGGSRRMVWLAAAVFLLAAGAVGFLERGAIVAMFAPQDHTKDIQPLPPPSPEQVGMMAKAAQLRADAARAKETNFYTRCKDDLDQAAKLDPAGEETPEVKDLRAWAEGKIAEQQERQRNRNMDAEQDPKR